MIYLGEIMIVAVFSFCTWIFGNGDLTPNNMKLVYPLQEVAKLECRSEEWAKLDDSCKINLPLIQNADYQKYAGNKLYTDIYTVLFGGNYLSGWAVDQGSHYGVDIASAKGTPLYSIANGKVYYAGPQAGYGNVVKIQFIYNGVLYFATYGHMDTISVQKGQPVSVGQKIWTIWNSGTTIGWLGGNHVHFEINKGTTGKPVYAFQNCADLKKWGIEVINQGLCRAEMFEHNLDPIPFLENAKAQLPHSASADAQEHNAAPQLSLTEMQDRKHLLKIAQLYVNSPYILGATGTLPGEPTDCSQYTKTIFGQVGITLEKMAADQASQFSSGGYWYEDISKAKVGDLIFFKNTYATPDNREITHVSIYAGENMLIHASADKVKITPFDQYWKEHFKGVGSFSQFALAYNKQKAESSYQKLSNIGKETPTQPEHPSAPVLTPSPEQKVPEQKPTQPAAPTPQPAQPSVPSPEQKAPEQKPTENQNSGLLNSLVQLDESRLDAVGKKFFSEWDISFTGNLQSQLKKWETTTFKLQIKNKANGSAYNGVLKQPIVLVASSTNLSIDPVAISFVKDWQVEIKLTAQQSGPVYTAINMGVNKMGGLNMQIY